MNLLSNDMIFVMMAFLTCFKLHVSAQNCSKYTKLNGDVIK